MLQSAASTPLLIYDFTDAIHGPQHYTFVDPVHIVEAHTVDDIYPALQAVEDAVQDGYYAAGFLSYESAPAFDPALAVGTPSDLPLLWFGIFTQPLPRDMTSPVGDFQISSWEPTISQAEYQAAIHDIKTAIAQGNTYQVNYTMRLRAAFQGDSLAWYRQLLPAQRAPYAAYLRLGRFQIVSLSPELFFATDGRRIITRPMKGTMPRGRWREDDEAQARRLRDSEKNQAENVMIVDLLRNDLNRVAEPGSVMVERLFELERYPTVHQMTSTISAQLHPQTSLTAILAALFPCGSITGAPKISTMHIIRNLEPTPRGIYCGTIGLLRPTGSAIFNVGIRTVCIDTMTGVAEFGTGGGITWDSSEGEEFCEALTKAEFLRPEIAAFQLLETLRWDGEGYFLLERHLSRLVASAEYFDIPLEPAAVRQELWQHVAAYPHAPRRVRLLVSQSGTVTVESTAFTAAPSIPQPVCLAQQPIDKSHRFLYHKTTHRSVYERHRQQCPTAFDVLLWNESGEITEFTRGNVIAEIAGQKWTPPIACGVLPGTFRAELMANATVHERVLTCAEVQQAERIWFVNSVRGWVLVHLAAPECGQRLLSENDG